MTNKEYADYRGTNMPQNKGENMYERQKRDDECFGFWRGVLSADCPACP